MSGSLKPTEQSKSGEHTLLYSVVVALIVMTIWGFASNWWSDSTPKDKELTEGTALSFCEDLAKNNAEYGFKKSLSDTSFEHVGSNVVVIFQNAKLGNAMGAEQNVNIKCTVSGTDNKPHLESFDAF